MDADAVHVHVGGRPEVDSPKRAVDKANPMDKHPLHSLDQEQVPTGMLIFAAPETVSRSVDCPATFDDQIGGACVAADERSITLARL